MKHIRWNFDKSHQLRQERNIEFEKIAVLIEDEEYIGIIDVPSRVEQKMFLLNYDEYVVCVPFVENEEEIFLKTAYKNRKVNKHIKRGK